MPENMPVKPLFPIQEIEKMHQPNAIFGTFCPILAYTVFHPREMN